MRSSTTTRPSPISIRLSARPGHVGITTRGRFLPNTNIVHARQRWLFRMVHSPAPLLERMTLVWHHHFATGYSKIAGDLQRERRHAADGGEGLRGSARACAVRSKCFRQGAFGSFRDLLVEVAKDPGDARLARRHFQREGPSRRRISAAN